METQRICPNCRKPLPPDVPLGLCPECLIKSGFPTEGGTGVSGEAAGARFVPPTIEEIAHLFPQLEILGFIGKGGMGAVYKARQPMLDRFIALKVLPPAVAGDPGFAERFNREARALARLNHPNIVAVYDFGTVGQASRLSPSEKPDEKSEMGTMPALHYLLMEFVDGTNLREIERTGKMAPEQALSIVPKICEALQYAHDQGVVHRDIKPENILLDKQGRVKIADFGIAKMVGQGPKNVSLTGAKDVVGTPHYMAPEQIEKPQMVDHRADIYSLGVVFYEMLTGELPLGKFAPPSKKVQVDVRLDEVVLHTLEKEPERRYQRASQVKTDVETITGTPAVAAVSDRRHLPGDDQRSRTAATAEHSDKAILPGFLLAFFFGVFGAHRFYVGRIWTGLLQLGAFGGCILLISICAALGLRVEPIAGILLSVFVVGCGIWATVDWILLVCKAFTDGQGRRVTHWLHSKPGKLQTDRGSTDIPPVDSAAREPAISQQDAGAPGTSPPPPYQKIIAAGTGMIVAPAVGLMVAAIWKLFSALAGLFFLAGWFSDEWLEPFKDFGIGPFSHWSTLASFSIVLFKVIPALLILFGAFQMLQIRSYAWSIAAGILSIVACSLVGLPMGIWALIVLARKDVRETFARQPKSPSALASVWPWLLGAVGMVTILIILAISASTRPPAMNLGETGKMPHGPPETAGHAPLRNMAETNLTRKNIAAAETQNQGLEKAPPASVNSTNQIIDVGDEANFSKSLFVEPVGKLTVNVDRGDIHVTGSDQNTVAVQVDRDVTHADDSEAARILKEERLVVKQTGNEISITAQDPLILHRHSFSGWWGWLSQPNLDVHYEITVPRKFDVQLETSGGSIKVASLEGSVNVKTEGGGLDFNDIEGKVNGQTAGGGIRAVSCQNELVIQTQGGGITIERFAGSYVRAATEGGSISADFATAPKADCELRTEGGSVTARLPHAAAITLDAHTEGGSVRTDLPVQVEGQFRDSTLKGTINGGGPLLELETAGGSIAVLKQ